ncbi:MAG TPA: mycofactocin biosynthesis chaperone MftB [Solirubrobacterales bacterium]|nr:mycofactocin biosynthesis chaperone MftB [Solirubrobacterales bacterium]
MDPETGLEGRWRLHPQVALRPERFGALAYHFGTRRLSFLKSPRLAAAVRGLEAAPDPTAACRAAGIGEGELPSYRRALATLAETGMIVPARGAFLSDSENNSPRQVAA